MGNTGRMTETTLYEKLLGIARSWRVRDVRLALEQGDVEVGVEFAGETLVCPACGAACPGYHRRRREWRHLDTMQYRTLVRAEAPRVRCAEHGVQQVRVPWAEAQSRFTALFEAMVIDWLKVASFSAVARQCRLSWGQVAGIQERAGSAGVVPAPGGRGAGGRRGRDVVPAAARVRDGRQRPDDVGAARAVRGGRALPRGPGRLLAGGRPFHSTCQARDDPPL